MNQNTKAKWNLFLNCGISAAGFIMGAAQPGNGWQWFLFATGIFMAVGPVIRATWNDTPGDPSLS